MHRCTVQCCTCTAMHLPNKDTLKLIYANSTVLSAANGIFQNLSPIVLVHCKYIPSLPLRHRTPVEGDFNKNSDRSPHLLKKTSDNCYTVKRVLGVDRHTNHQSTFFFLPSVMTVESETQQNVLQGHQAEFYCRIRLDPGEALSGLTERYFQAVRHNVPKEMGLSQGSLREGSKLSIYCSASQPGPWGPTHCPRFFALSQLPEAKTGDCLRVQRTRLGKSNLQ